MKIYLCGPIFGRGDVDCRDWREEAKRLWRGECIDPMRRDYRGKEAQLASEIVENDLADIRESDGLLVYFDRPSVGTSMEVFFAHSIGKKIAAINASGGPVSPWLVHHVHHFAPHIDGALFWLWQWGCRQ